MVISLRWLYVNPELKPQRKDVDFLLATKHVDSILIKISVIETISNIEHWFIFISLKQTLDFHKYV